MSFPLCGSPKQPHFSLPLFLFIPVQNLISGVRIRRVVLSSSRFGGTFSCGFKLCLSKIEVCQLFRLLLGKFCLEPKNQLLSPERYVILKHK